MSKFQIFITGFFGVCILVAVVLFSLSKGSGDKSANIMIWGDIPSYEFQSLINDTTLGQDQDLVIEYVEKPTVTISEDLTEALAAGAGPDLVILPIDKLHKQKNKLIPIPYKNISERDFTSTFVEEAELYLETEGIYALPISLDPLVLYYNRDILSAENVAQPLAYWDELFSASLTLTKKDAAGNLRTSAIALGEAKNIMNAKDILALLMLQAGSSITGYIGQDLESLLTHDFDLPTIPAESALEFYTQFSNPSKPYYSWNRSLPEARDRFVAGNSAYYLGFASEWRTLRNKNPNLNFSVTLVPQSRVSGKKITLGNLRGVSITRNTNNAGASLSAALKLVSPEIQTALSERLVLPPIRRDLLALEPSDNVYGVFYEAALQSKGWIDPDDNGTSAIFAEMIEAVTSGRARTSEALRKASEELDKLI